MDHENILGMRHESVLACVMNLLSYLVPMHSNAHACSPGDPSTNGNSFRLHEGSNVVSGCKYIIRSDVLYTLPLAKP